MGFRWMGSKVNAALPGARGSRAAGDPAPLPAPFSPQKLTWRSNPGDINVCRMKGKQEVSGPWPRPDHAHNPSWPRPGYILLPHP